MREVTGTRGALRELPDGTWVMEVAVTREAARAALEHDLGAPVCIAFAPAQAAPATSTAPVQTVSTAGTESLSLGNNTPQRPEHIARMRLIHGLVQTPTFQAFAWQRSGMQQLPPDAVEHAADWLMERCGVKSPNDLLTGPAAERADQIIAEFRATASAG